MKVQYLTLNSQSLINLKRIKDKIKILFIIYVKIKYKIKYLFVKS